MSAHEFRFKEAQLLLSQVIHDLISLFTSLSAGIDYAQETKGEIWDLVKKTKEQLYAQISIFRFVFSAGEGNLEEANKVIKHFGKAFDIEVKGHIQEQPKIGLAMALWLVKQAKNRQGTSLAFDQEKLVLSSPHLFPFSDKDEVLKGTRRFQSCQESYAGYISSLVALHGKKISISRSSTEVCIGLGSGPSNSKNFES